MKNTTTINLKFNVKNSDPLKDEIFKKFSELMELLQRTDDKLCREIDKSAKEAEKILNKGGKCYG